MPQEFFSIKKRLESFKYAFNGLRILLLEEHNARIHLVAAIVAVICGFVFKISNYEWISIIFAISLVFALEIINTVIENLADFISPGIHKKIKIIKDLSSAAVLIGALAAFAVGLLIFIPKICTL